MSDVEEAAAALRRNAGLDGPFGVREMASVHGPSLVTALEALSTSEAAREAAETKLGEALHALGGAVLAFKRAGLHEVDLPLDAAVARQIARAEAAERERDRWKANHDEMVARNAILRQRPDLPVDRIPAIEALAIAERRVGELEALAIEANAFDEAAFYRNRTAGLEILEARAEKAEAALAPLQARIAELEADLTIRVELAESKAEGRLLEMLLAYTASPETWPAEDYVVFRQFRYAIEKARKKAEAALGPLQARIREMEASVRDTTCPYPVLPDHSVVACVGSGKCGCTYGVALAPLQAMVDEARKVIEPFAFEFKHHEQRPDNRLVVTDTITVGHFRKLVAWLSATPTDLLNSRLAEVWDRGREAAIRVVAEGGIYAPIIRALSNPYRKPEEPGT